MSKYPYITTEEQKKLPWERIQEINAATDHHEAVRKQDVIDHGHGRRKQVLTTQPEVNNEE